MKKSYSEQLRDPRWQKKRLEVLERSGWKCQWCDITNDELHVHHAYYEKGKSPWEYDDSVLFCLCKTCHSKAEAITKQFALIISENGGINWFIIQSIVEKLSWIQKRYPHVKWEQSLLMACFDVIVESCCLDTACYDTKNKTPDEAIDIASEVSRTICFTSEKRDTK